MAVHRYYLLETELSNANVVSMTLSDKMRINQFFAEPNAERSGRPAPTVALSQMEQEDIVVEPQENMVLAAPSIADLFTQLSLTGAEFLEITVSDQQTNRRVKPFLIMGATARVRAMGAFGSNKNRSMKKYFTPLTTNIHSDVLTVEGTKEILISDRARRELKKKSTRGVKLRQVKVFDTSLADSIDSKDSSHLSLPGDLFDFVYSGRQLKYPVKESIPGRLALRGLDELSLGSVWVDSEKAPIDGDPNEGKIGYYTVPAFSLTKKCTGYEPEFLLLWLPTENLYGTWDCDHGHLVVFPDATWSDIVRDPIPFINAQWDANENGAYYFVPWPEYPYTLGLPG